MATLLLVEDSKDFQLTVSAALGPLGHRLVIAADGKEALVALGRHEFDLILLDISLPDQDGFEFLTQIRDSSRFQSIPVIFLTGKSDVANKVTAFSLGAEDYIVKPFNVLEFRARIEAKIRKNAALAGSSQIVRIGALELNLSAQRAYLGTGSEKTELRLTAMEFRLLGHLVQNHDRVFSREQLLESVWGNAVDVFDRTVDAHICGLRRKLGPMARCIESVRAVGYRFVSPEEKARDAA